MKRELAPALALSAALVAGCSSSHETTSFPGATYSAPPVNESSSPLSSVNVGILPNELPEALKAEEPNAVVVIADIPAGHGKFKGLTTTQFKPYNGSGVRIGKSLYITAGHMVDSAQNRPLKSSLLCGDLVVDGASKNVDAYQGLHTKLYGSQADVHKQFGTYRKDDDSQLPDFALLDAPNLDDGVAPYKHVVRINNRPIQIGTPLFFENYQPTANGINRNPNQSYVSLKQIKQGYTKPAIFGGVVISRELNGDLVVVNGLKSYGVIDDSLGRAGESGGGVFSSQDTLVGEGIQGPEKPMPAEQVGQLFGVKLLGIKPEQVVTYTIVQPVTPKLVGKYTLKLDSTQHCHYPDNSAN